MEHRREAGLDLDDLLEHDVGLVEAALRPGLLVVVDLDDEGRPPRCEPLVFTGANDAAPSSGVT